MFCVEACGFRQIPPLLCDTMRHDKEEFSVSCRKFIRIAEGLCDMGLRKMQEMLEEKERRGQGDAGEEEALRLSVGYATAAAEEISGDTAISSGLPDGSLALILSDGMGKGIMAAAESRAVARRLRKNLKSGMRPAFAIKEVNRYMLACEEAQTKCDDRRNCWSEAQSNAKKCQPAVQDDAKKCRPATQECEKKPEPLQRARAARCSSAAAGEAECFATVDLLIIDRNAAKAKFYKMGAASSFLLRNGKVKKFEQAALPIGIIPEVRLNHIVVRLKAGDIVVMVSDGVTEAARADGSNGAWLHELLESRTAAELAHLSARRLAGEILGEAILRYADRERDDLTVAVVKIL